MGEGEQLDKAFKAWRMTTNAPRFSYPGIRMETLWRGFAAYQAERIKTLEMERDYRPRMDEWEAAQERIAALEADVIEARTEADQAYRRGWAAGANMSTDDPRFPWRAE